MTDQQHHPHHGHVHLGDADWEAMAAQTELEGELFLGFVTDTAAWAAELHGTDAPAVRRIIDIGSGPGVGSCELARMFPEARVTAVDSSPAMLKRAQQRAHAAGLDGRIVTHLTELPEGIEGLAAADLIWASMSLHHLGDEVGSLRALRGLLGPNGLIAIAELNEPLRVLPDDLVIGRPGLADRLERAGAAWFVAMRDGLPDSVPSADLQSMLTSAGFTVAGSRVARRRFDPPLSKKARRVALGHLRRLRQQLDEHLDHDDLQALDVLTDTDDPRGVAHRSDAFVSSSRQIVIARPTGGS